ncbi:cytochrome P450 1A1 [Polypterus senegalus]|uniref:cytochrome P450 1A1 n=1 Tax=Polypterus senegalus TaxID=55291 RepID=UPI0019662FBE|nr:cytochrome P450 1A1 [Polypterus senegalus]
MTFPMLVPLTVSESLLALVTICLVYWWLKVRRSKIPDGLKRPPGPKSLPIIGNLLDLGRMPHLSLKTMSQTYGDVFQIQIGMRPVVVLSNYDIVRQALLKQGDDFAGRPDLYSFQFISNGKSIAFSHDHHGVWKPRRKLAQNALRTFSFVQRQDSRYSSVLEQYICEEGDYLVKKIVDIMKSKGSFDPFRYVVVSVTNIICAMCFGQRYSHDDEELLSFVNLSEQFGEIAGNGNPADFIPFLRFLPNPAMRKFVAINARFNKFVERIVKDHYHTFDKNNIRDITDSLIEHCQDKKVDENSNIQISDDKIISIVNDLFGAGFDTVTSSLSWALLYLSLYPEIQKKIHEEIDMNVDKEHGPRLSDKSKLPYVEAFILEVLRHSSFVPFTIPHCTTKDTSLNGIYIPKNTCIFINQWQINHDPNHWKDPSSFSPERFLEDDGTSINRALAEKVMIFGMGKRRCIGEPIARAEVFLFLTVLLQHLEFYSLPSKPIDLTPKYGLILRHHRFHLGAALRT